jgi:hypothetical protein
MKSLNIRISDKTYFAMKEIIQRDEKALERLDSSIIKLLESWIDENRRKK